MPTGSIDLTATAERLLNRAAGRAEATVQSDLRMLLLAAGLNLREENLHEVVLEAPVGQRRRIDVEVGATVFEVKRDLRAGNVRAEAVAQLAGYVAERVQETGARYAGVLTDGAEWHLYHLDAGELSPVSSFTLASTAALDDLIIWLDGVLATTSAVNPTPASIARRLGAGSPAHSLDVADLSALYERHKAHPSVALKRTLWAKLLTTALGTAFSDEDSLFIEHTLLVISAEVIGHAVIGFDPAHPDISPATLVRGQLFTDAQIRGVIEEDFFDWVVEVPGGAAFITTLARRLARFNWGEVEHDVMKVLYESVINPQTRHSLGEYYTPDWLAEAIVTEFVSDPLAQRVLDPSCGSGTFLFHAVRHYLGKALEAGMSEPDAILGVTSKVLGVDVHPVAVTFARVTYLLALGRDRLSRQDRPAFSVPVYLGDAVQWGQNATLIDTEALVVPTGDGATLFADELRFPDRVVEDAGRFDALVSDLADSAARPNRPAAEPLLRSVFRRHGIHEADQPMIAATYRTMCELHDTGRDHIWGYYVRNLARPIWLARAQNRVDVLIGNPPWLSYRFMPAEMKANFRAMSEARGFWAGAAVATHQDLSALYVARAVEQYLKPGGRFSFVMPFAVLSRRQFAGFRTGRWGGPNIGQADVAFDKPWDLHAVKPSFFPVPAAVVSGTNAGPARTLSRSAESWVGRLRGRNPTLAQAMETIARRDPVEGPIGSSAVRSPYAARFGQGATLVPRFLFIVERDQTGPLGAGAGRTRVRSKRSNNEKMPWKALPGHTGSVENQFLKPVLVGDSVLPFMLRTPQTGVIPWDGSSLAETTTTRLDYYPGLAEWWRSAEQTWDAHRSSSMSLREQIDFRKKLSEQLPGPAHRVVYSASGMYLAAAYVSDHRAVVEHMLYWATVSGVSEGRFLTGVLNSDALLELVRPLQSRGEHNPRHFDKYIWQLPIPLYDPTSDLHSQIVDVARQAEEAVATLELPNLSFQAVRRRVREHLTGLGIAQELDKLVRELLA